MRGHKKIKLIYGVGINDADYEVQPKDSKACPYYMRWKSMLARCYSKSYQEKFPTYAGCEVCSNWLYFTKFRSWMETQDWEGNHLDKDLLIEGNKVYSPVTCIFVSPMVNSFLVDSRKDKGEYPTGVNWNTEVEKFLVRCSNLSKGSKHLGYFDCPNEGKLVYDKYKKSLALELALMQTDERVKTALLVKYS